MSLHFEKNTHFGFEHQRTWGGRLKHPATPAPQAEVRALAKRMLRKRSRDELLEGAYNKYAFHDAGLPRWFAEDQRRHARWAPAHSRRAAVKPAQARLAEPLLAWRHHFSALLLPQPPPKTCPAMLHTALDGRTWLATHGSMPMC